MAKAKSSDTFTVDLNKTLVTLKGAETDIHIGEIIAEAISQCGSEQCKSLKPVKLMAWAQKLAMKEPLSLDEPDFDSLREFIGLLPRLNILVLTQADECFKLAKEAKQPKM